MSKAPSAPRPPVVTDADREWAMALMPPWCVRGGTCEPVSEIADDGAWLEAGGAPRKAAASAADFPDWSRLVDEQIEAFERFFAGQTKTPGEWSALWRRGWWPKVDARKRFPRSAPKVVHPHFAAGTPEFARALAVANRREKAMWERFGVAQFTPDDPRLAQVRSGVVLPHAADPRAERSGGSGGARESAGRHASRPAAEENGEPA